MQVASLMRTNPAARFAVDGAGRALDHAHGVEAVHAGLGHHVMPVRRPVAEEARVVVVGGGAGADAVVAARAAVQVDHHRRRAVDDALFHQEFEQIGGDFSMPRRRPHGLAGRRGAARGRAILPGGVRRKTNSWTSRAGTNTMLT